MEPIIHPWSDIISAAVVPIVIISACGLLCLAFYNRLAVVVTRLRSLQRERLSEYKELFRFEEEEKAKLLRNETEQFLHFLEKQTVDVLKRARYLRNCLFCLIVSIFSLVITSLVIGLSLLYPILDVVVLCFFVGGLFLLLSALVFAVMEIKISLSPIKMECGFVERLIKSQLEKNSHVFKETKGKSDNTDEFPEIF